MTKPDTRVPARLGASVVLALLLWRCIPDAGADTSDPFETDVRRPPAPSGLWDDPRTPIPCVDTSRPADPIALPAAIDIALCRNPGTRQSWAAAKVAAAQAGAAESARLPSVTGTVSGQSSDTRNSTAALSGRRDQLNGTIAFNYLLFDFGGRNATMEQARQNLAAANWTHNATIQGVVLNVSQAFYQLFAADEAVRAARAAEKFARDSLDAAEARQRAGTATRADVLQARTALSQAVLTRTQSEGAAASARGVLASAMGLEADRALTLAPPGEVDGRSLGETAVADLMEAARMRRPELRAAEANVRAAESAVAIEQSASKPSLSAFGNANATVVSPGSDPRSMALGITLNIPFFTGYRNTYTIRAAQAQVERQSAARDQLRNDVSLEVWRAYQDVRTQQQALASAGDLVSSATESYDVALGRYRAGVGTLIDMLNAQTALVQATIQQIQARFSLNIAKIALARAVGVLDSGLFTAGTPTSP